MGQLSRLKENFRARGTRVPAIEEREKAEERKRQERRGRSPRRGAAEKNDGNNKDAFKERGNAGNDARRGRNESRQDGSIKVLPTMEMAAFVPGFNKVGGSPRKRRLSDLRLVPVKVGPNGEETLIKEPVRQKPPENAWRKAEASDSDLPESSTEEEDDQESVLAGEYVMEDPGDADIFDLSRPKSNPTKMVKQVSQAQYWKQQANSYIFQNLKYYVVGRIRWNAFGALKVANDKILARQASKSGSNSDSSSVPSARPSPMLTAIPRLEDTLFAYRKERFDNRGGNGMRESTSVKRTTSHDGVEPTSSWPIPDGHLSSRKDSKNVRNDGLENDAINVNGRTNPTDVLGNGRANPNDGLALFMVEAKRKWEKTKVVPASFQTTHQIMRTLQNEFAIDIIACTIPFIEGGPSFLKKAKGSDTFLDGPQPTISINSRMQSTGSMNRMHQTMSTNSYFNMGGMNAPIDGTVNGMTTGWNASIGNAMDGASGTTNSTSNGPVPKIPSKNALKNDPTTASIINVVGRDGVGRDVGRDGEKKNIAAWNAFVQKRLQFLFSEKRLLQEVVNLILLEIQHETEEYLIEKTSKPKQDSKNKNKKSTPDSNADDDDISEITNSSGSSSSEREGDLGRLLSPFPVDLMDNFGACTDEIIDEILRATNVETMDTDTTNAELRKGEAYNPEALNVRNKCSVVYRNTVAYAQLQQTQNENGGQNGEQTGRSGVSAFPAPGSMSPLRTRMMSDVAGNPAPTGACDTRRNYAATGSHDFMPGNPPSATLVHTTTQSSSYCTPTQVQAHKLLQSCYLMVRKVDPFVLGEVYPTQQVSAQLLMKNKEKERRRKERYFEKESARREKYQQKFVDAIVEFEASNGIKKEKNVSPSREGLVFSDKISDRNVSKDTSKDADSADTEKADTEKESSSLASPELQPTADDGTQEKDGNQQQSVKGKKVYHPFAYTDDPESVCYCPPVREKVIRRNITEEERAMIWANLLTEMEDEIEPFYGLEAYPSRKDIPPKKRKLNWMSKLDLSHPKDLVNYPTYRQNAINDLQDEVIQLVGSASFRKQAATRDFENKDIGHTEYCEFRTFETCRHNRGQKAASALSKQGVQDPLILQQAYENATCNKIHFRKVIHPWTNVSLGDCSYLNTCRKMNTCPYIHYALDITPEQNAAIKKKLRRGQLGQSGHEVRKINELQIGAETALPPQWINCDVRNFNFGMLHNLVDVVMADPPWDIHMELPYGTLKDDEMRNLEIGKIHDNGMIFLWVTARAAELARDCMKAWGYKRVEEIIWVKTNQLQRIIRTGRTGHWLNHSKEHCLVGVKGTPRGLTRNLDVDVIVSEVRETSRKPDEIYNVIERMFPGSLKVEIFGRPHNVFRNWITLGNQLLGTHVCNEELVNRYNDNLKPGEAPAVAFDPNDPVEANREADGEAVQMEPEDAVQAIREGQQLQLTDGNVIGIKPAGHPSAGGNSLTWQPPAGPPAGKDGASVGKAGKDGAGKGDDVGGKGEGPDGKGAQAAKRDTSTLTAARPFRPASAPNSVAVGPKVEPNVRPDSLPNQPGTASPVSPSTLSARYPAGRSRAGSQEWAQQSGAVAHSPKTQQPGAGPPAASPPHSWAIPSQSPPAHAAPGVAPGTIGNTQGALGQPAQPWQPQYSYGPPGAPVAQAYGVVQHGYAGKPFQQPGYYPAYYGAYGEMGKKGGHK